MKRRPPDPLWWFMRYSERKYPAHVRIRLARQRRKHQRWLRLSIRIKRALPILEELNAASVEVMSEIWDPQALLDHIP